LPLPAPTTARVRPHPHPHPPSQINFRPTRQPALLLAQHNHRVNQTLPLTGSAPHPHKLLNQQATPLLAKPQRHLCFKFAHSTLPVIALGSVSCSDQFVMAYTISPTNRRNDSFSMNCL
jgi:hypothetical protein